MINSVQLSELTMKSSNKKEGFKNKEYFDNKVTEYKEEQRSNSVKTNVSAQNCSNNTEQSTHNHCQQPIFSLYTTENIQDTRFFMSDLRTNSFFNNPIN